MKYRAELDGLRALAVIPVILFHAGYSWFGGGFVGVDVFFVISGYLITTILIEEIEKNQFSLVRFFERRARRILPALFFVMLICIPFAWLWMLPDQLKDFSQSLAAVSLFISNILFWRESGYFEESAEEKPLLHTWSLAVEEQYYILFPTFLFLLWRFGRNRVFWTIVGIAFVSLLVSEWGWRNKPTANFYLSPSRAWELLAGSISAFVVQKYGIKSNNLLSMVGLIAIFVSIFVYDHLTPFPSVYALLPVLGVVLLVLFADEKTYAARFLSTKAFVGIGLISYSAYLWHQPLFAFARLRSPEEPGGILMGGLSMLTVLLAGLSWKYVEKPFRVNTSRTISKKRIFLFSGVGLAFFSGFGIVGHLAEGYPKRVSGWTELTKTPDVGTSYCHNLGRRTEQQLLEDDFCTIGQGVIELAIIGDSHAGAIFGYADEYLKKRNIGALAVSGGFCAPLLNEFETWEGCRRTHELTYDRIIRDQKITKVILVAEWANYTKGYRGDEMPQLWRDRHGAAAKPSENADVFARSFRVTIQRLIDANKKVLVVHPVPEFNYGAYRWLGLQVLTGNYKNVSGAVYSLPRLTLTQYRERNSEVFEVFRENSSGVSYLSVADLFCDQHECRQFGSRQEVLYSDFNHVNFHGAQLIVEKIGAEFL